MMVAASVITWPRDGAGDPDEIGHVRDILEEGIDSIFAPDDKETDVRFVDVIEDDDSNPRVELADNDEDIHIWLENEAEENKTDENDGREKDEDDDGIQQYTEPKCRARFFSVYPIGQQGRGKLAATRPSMLRILDFLDVFPQFYRYIAAYGYRAYATDESFGGFDFNITSNQNSTIQILESCYLLKYVERRNEGNSRAWSLRQCLLYQKTHFNHRDLAKLTDHILIRPSQMMRDRLTERMSAPQTGGKGLVFDWTAAHSACWSGIDRGFREMTNELDEEVTEISDRIMISSISPSELTYSESPTAVAHDMKTLQSLTDKLNRLRSIININLQTLKALKKFCKSLLPANNDRHHLRLPDGEDGKKVRAFVETLRKWKREHHFADAHAVAILERASVSASQLRDTVAMRNNEINRVSSDAIFELSRRSSYEANIVKLLTVLALIFLPANFVADFLQMGYIKLSENASFHIEAERDLKIYAVLAIPLMVATMATYCFAEGLKSRSLRKVKRRRITALEEGQTDEEEGN